jgi:hypothetical protein
LAKASCTVIFHGSLVNSIETVPGLTIHQSPSLTHKDITAKSNES